MSDCICDFSLSCLASLNANSTIEINGTHLLDITIASTNAHDDEVPSPFGWFTLLTNLQVSNYKGIYEDLLFFT